MDRRLFEETVELLATGQVNVKPMVTHVLQGLEQVPAAFALTADKSRHGLVNPAQVVVSVD
jgi:threonine dehydrogenase-like Zn-dependent dehydrogenase